MTNQQINDFLKEAYTVFRNYRDRRPVMDEKTKAEINDAMSELTAKYGEGAKNEWVYYFAFGLYYELEGAG